MDDHGAEIRKLRESLAILRSEAEANEAILRRSQARELFLLLMIVGGCAGSAGIPPP